jgi:FADH2 O2-dependent halogenase
VTTYERRRAAADGCAHAFANDFLCADEDALRRIADEAYRRVAAWSAPPASAPVAAYEQFIEEAVQPFNRVGLFDPPIANMYPHTAAPA